MDRKSLTCPVCLEVRWDIKIFQCLNGHIVCEGCVDCDDRCSVCRSVLPNPRARNIIAEDCIRDIMEKECRHQGCDYKAV